MGGICQRAEEEKEVVVEKAAKTLEEKKEDMLSELEDQFESLYNKIAIPDGGIKVI